MGLVALLRQLYGQLNLPPAVYREVVTEGHGRAGAEDTAEAVTAGWLTVQALRTLGFRLRARVYQQALQYAGEVP